MGVCELSVEALEGRWDIILPLELQLMIMGYLLDAPNTLASLSLVNRRVRSLATRELYRSIRLRSERKWSQKDPLYRRRDAIFKRQALLSDTLASFPSYALMVTSVVWQWNPAMTWETLAMFTNLKSLDLDCWTYNYTHSIFTQTPKNLSFPRLREATFRGTHPKGAITSIVMGSPNLEAVHFLDMAGEVVEISWDPDDIEQRHASSLKRFLERCVECQLLPKLHTLTLQCYPDWEKSTSSAHDTIVTWVPFLRYAGPRLRKLIIKLENYENDTGNDTRRCLLKDLGPLLQQADQLENLECFSISLQRCHCIEECRPPYDTNMRLLNKNFLGQEGASYAGLTITVSS